MAPDAILHGELRPPNGDRIPTSVNLRVRGETLVFDLGSGDRIEAGNWAFTSAAIWLRGAIDGLWDPPSLGSIDGLVLWGDLSWTAIAPGDFSRALWLSTEALQDCLFLLREPHETTSMQSPFEDTPVDIDQGLVELIAELWALGAVTSGCCENLGGRATITFEDASSAERFLEAVISETRPVRPEQVEMESIYNRVAGFTDDEPDDWQAFRKRRMWTLEAQVHEFGCLRNGPDRFAPGAEALIAITVNFPVADVSVALESVRAVNHRHGRVPSPSWLDD